MAGPGFAPPPPPPSSSGGSSGSSKKKGPAGPSHPGSPGGADYYGFYLGIIQGLGIGINKDVLAFAHHANTQHWTSGTFMYYLRQTAFYHAEFPGIMGPNNSLRMSETQYIANFNSLTDTASSLGMNFTRQQFGYAISKGLQAGTIAARLTAIARVKESPVVFHQFEQELRASGVSKTAVKKADLYDFVMGMGDQRWYKVWQEASLRAGAAEAGLRIGSDITRRELARLGRSLPGFQAETDYAKQFADLAQNIRSFAPLSQLAGLGLTNHDLEVLEFGGAHRLGRSREDIAAQASRILETVKNQSQGPAVPQLVSSQGGPELLGTQGLSRPPEQTL